jgi:hypothetical protein
MPLSAGSASKNFWKASRPPAEAPIPTTGKSRSRGEEARIRDSCPPGRGRAVLGRRRCPVVVPDFVAVASTPLKPHRDIIARCDRRDSLG